MAHEHSFVDPVREDAFKNYGKFLQKGPDFIMYFGIGHLNNRADAFGHFGLDAGRCPETEPEFDEPLFLRSNPLVQLQILQDLADWIHSRRTDYAAFFSLGPAR